MPKGKKQPADVPPPKRPRKRAPAQAPLEPLPPVQPTPQPLPAPGPADWVTPELDSAAFTAGPDMPLHTLVSVRKIIVEKALRRIEALNLYEPLHEQERFHASTCRQRLLRGSNRGGKTLPAAIEVGRALTGRDPAGKYPSIDGRVFAVGKNLDHVGQVMWRKLGRPGAFKIIKDLGTGEWRAFRPWTQEDQSRREQARPAPPILPRRLIKSIAWENKAKSIPKQVTLHNGWEINFYSSEGKPPQGSDVDLWWFDEEIVDEDWHPEMVARVLDRGGRGIWSATPQAGTEKLLELHELADRERLQERPAVEEFVILLADNPHLGEQEKRDFAASLNEEQQRVRVAGEFLIHSWRVYPEYSRYLHGSCRFEIPGHWTRYVAVDPGRQICACLFLAVSPPEEGDHVFLYDELYIQNSDAEQFGQKMREKCAAQIFESFIIDSHGSRVTEMGSGRTVEEQYSAKLRKYRVSSRRTGHGFTWGSDDIEGGLEAVRGWLRVRDDGTPRLRVFWAEMPNWEWEVQHYRYKRVNNVVTDKPEERGRVHLMACMRYLAMARPKCVRVKGTSKPLEGAIKAFREKEKRRRDRDGSNGRVLLGPTSREGR